MIVSVSKKACQIGSLNYSNAFTFTVADDLDVGIRGDPISIVMIMSFTSLFCSLVYSLAGMLKTLHFSDFKK